MKKIISIVVCGALIFGLIGCESTATNTNSETKETVIQEGSKKDAAKSTNPLDDLKKAFANAGLTVGENKELAYSMLGATSGYKFQINGKLIEIYYYDSKNLDEDQKKFYNQAKNGSVDIGGLNVPVVFKNDIMMTRIDKHPNKDKILEVFNNFKY